MRIQTRGNSTTVWLCSDIGVIDGTMTMSAPTLDKILQAVNEKYGTSFEGWSQLPTAYEVGDTIPNWNAYEKIELPGATLWKLYYPNSTVGPFGKIENNVLIIFSETLEMGLIAKENGEIVGKSEINEVFINEQIKPKLNALGITFNNFAYDTSTYRIGDTVENWNQYTLLS